MNEVSEPVKIKASEKLSEDLRELASQQVFTSAEEGDHIVVP